MRCSDGVPGGYQSGDTGNHPALAVGRRIPANRLGDRGIAEHGAQVPLPAQGQALSAAKAEGIARDGPAPTDDQLSRLAAMSQSASRVVVETLHVAGMMLNRRMARAIADAGMSGFLTKLEYKCPWYGAEYEKADRWFPSSKLCAHCGWHNGDLSLSDHQWRCDGCSALNDRDGNAAENLSPWPRSSYSASGRGDRVRPVTPAVACEVSTNLPAASGLLD